MTSALNHARPNGQTTFRSRGTVTRLASAGGAIPFVVRLVADTNGSADGVSHGESRRASAGVAWGESSTAATGTAATGTFGAGEGALSAFVGSGETRSGGDEARDGAGERSVIARP